MATTNNITTIRIVIEEAIIAINVIVIHIIVWLIITVEMIVKFLKKIHLINYHLQVVVIS